MPELTSMLDDFKLDSPPTTEQPPLPPEPEPGTEKPPVVEPEKKDEVAADTAGDPDKKVETATPEVGQDPELSVEQNAAIVAAAPEQREALEKEFKTAKFETYFRSSAKPPGEIVDYMAGLSDARFGEIQDEIVNRRLKDPTEFATWLFTNNPEKYGELMGDAYKANPQWFAEQVTGQKGVDPATVPEMVKFYSQNKDLVSTVAELPAEVIRELESRNPNPDPDDEATAKPFLEQDYPATAAYLKSLKAKAGTGPAPLPADVQAQLDELATIKAKEAKPADKPIDEVVQERMTAAQTAEAKRLGNFESAWMVGMDYIQAYADDPKNGLGLKVTEAEREAAPEVADLKTTKRGVFIDGMEGVLPPFSQGFGEWGKENAAVKKLIDDIFYYSDRDELENGKAKMRELQPFLDQYKQIRLKHPYFARIDKQMGVTSKTPRPPVEVHIPGSASQALPSGAKTLNDEIDSFMPER